jgi:DNA-directed RNA polymerase specialized sigma24 family protein
VAATRDSRYVGRHDEEKLRRFLAARRVGDEPAARGWWEALLTDNFDRIRAMVALQNRGRLSRDEQQEALQRALIRIASNMIHTFRGTSMGEWVESTRTLVKFECIDTQRRAARTSRRERSLDPSDQDDGDAERVDAELYAAIEQQQRELETAEEDLEDLRHGQAFLDWAVPQISSKRRAVIELDRQDIPVEEIQRRLGVSRDVVYACRSRALKDLANLRGSYQP